MPDGLYERDIQAWCDQQANLPRRLERGERDNDVDWQNIAEGIKAVGRIELYAVQHELSNPFTLDHLLSDDIDILLGRLPTR